MRLEATGRLKELHFHRVMSEKEVTDVILNGFSIKAFKFLVPLKDNTFTTAKKQILNGSALIAMAGSGSVYLQECPPSAAPDTSAGSTTEELPIAKFLSKGSKVSISY